MHALVNRKESRHLCFPHFERLFNNENGPHMLTCVTIWSLVGGTTWEGLEGVTDFLSGGHMSLGAGFEVLKPMPCPVKLFLPCSASGCELATTASHACLLPCSLP